jgi:predicted trehalose synthase
LRVRLDAAIREAPELEAHRAEIERVFELARVAPWPARQRIHGDYHLGQVLTAPGLGWVLVDFEGEPLRPMAERTQLDIPLRDVAGMLRSFHYVAGCLALEKSLEVSDWAVSAREAFLDGYVEASGYDVREHRALLDAFEIDKALYEAVYEARNRPHWLEIPVRAIIGLAERTGAQT